MDNARFTPLENIDSRNKGQSRVFNFRCANESGEYAKEFARRHSLPGVVIELIGFINGDMDVNVMSIASEEAYKIKEVLEEGKIDAIRDIELAWKTLCVILYGKTQYLIKNVTNPKDFINFFKELKKDNYLQLEFAPEDSRKLPFCCDVFQNLQIMQKISIFFAKASVTGAQYTYLTGGIVLLPSSGEYVIKDLKDGRILFKCKYIRHIEDTRLFEFSHDHELWGLVDDLGRVVAKEKYTGLFLLE